MVGVGLEFLKENIGFDKEHPRDSDESYNQKENINGNLCAFNTNEGISAWFNLTSVESHVDHGSND